MCLLIQYGIYNTVYCFRLWRRKVSSEIRKRHIVKSGKDSMWRYLAKYVGILGKICGDTWQFISTYWKWGLNRFVMPYEMRVCFLSVIGGILEPFVGESFQFFRRWDAVFKNESYHSTSTWFCPYSLHLEWTVCLTYVEERMNDFDLCHHSFPIKKMLVFLSREVNENAIICLDTIDEDFS